MKIKYFDRAIEWLFMSMMFLLPVIFDRRIGIVFSGTKSATIRLFILAILTIWFIKVIISGKHNFKRTILDWPILSYLLAATAATILSVNTIISFNGFYGRYEGLITWYCYALMFFIAVNYIRGFEKLKQLVAIIAPTATAMAVYGIIQRHGIDPYVWGGVVTWQRVIATIGQPNFLSAYVDMAFFLMIYFLLTTNVQTHGQKPLVVETPKNKKQQIQPKHDRFDWNEIINNHVPVLYFLLTPLLFVLMMFSQSGQNIFVWYSFFIAMTLSSLMFAYNYHKLPDISLKFLAGTSALLIYICNFYTQSRGGYLGIGVGIVLLILLVPRKRIIDNWKPLSLLALALITVSAITIVNPENSPFARFTSEIKAGGGEQEIKQGAPKESQNQIELGGAAGSRGETWKSAAGIIADNPIFGIGPEDLKMIFPRYETNLFRFKEAFHVKQDRCHNETFDVPVTKGLLTFFIYLSILFMIFRFGLQKLKIVSDDKKVLIAVTLSAMSSYIVQNQFSFGVIAITSIFWVLWAIVMNIDKSITPDDIPWIPVGITIFAFLILGYLSLLQFEADKQFKTGKTYLDMRRFSEAIPFFKSSLDWFPFEGGTITHYGISLLNSAMQGAPQDQGRILDEALKMFDYGIKVDPYNADNLYISSRIFFMKGDLARSLEYAQKALKVDPYYAEAYLTLAALAERTGNFAQAQKYYDEAYRINPNLSESKIKVAESLLAQGRLDDAFNILQEMLTSDPKNPAVHNGLGTVYLKRGQRERAKEEFEQTLSIDPNNAYAKMMLKK